MNKTDIAKKIVSTIVGTGTSKIVHGIIQNNVPVNNNIDKVTVVSASAVLGYAAQDASSSYTDRKIDEIINWYKTNVKPQSDTPSS